MTPPWQTPRHDEPSWCCGLTVSWDLRARQQLCSGGGVGVVAGPESALFFPAGHKETENIPSHSTELYCATPRSSLAFALRAQKCQKACCVVGCTVNAAKTQILLLHDAYVCGGLSVTAQSNNKSSCQFKDNRAAVSHVQVFTFVIVTVTSNHSAGSFHKDLDLFLC